MDIHGINGIAKKFEKQLQEIEKMFFDNENQFNKQLSKLDNEQKAFFKDAYTKAKNNELTVETFSKLLNEKLKEWR